MTRRIDPARTQVTHEQVPAAEHVPRQIALTAVVAVKEPVFLLAVQRRVRGVDIQNQTPRHRLPQVPPRTGRTTPDEVPPPSPGRRTALLRATQRRRTRQGLYPGSRRPQGRIVTQLPMTIQVLRSSA